MITPQKFFEIVPQNINMDIRSELYSINEFTFAVAVILSAQATDKKVNEVTPELFRVAPTPRKMLELGIDGLKQHIRVISFFNNKATNIIKLAEILADGQGINWKFPPIYHNRDALIKLPGPDSRTATRNPINVKCLTTITIVTVLTLGPSTVLDLFSVKPYHSVHRPHHGPRRS